jgi:hypothetical protein
VDGVFVVVSSSHQYYKGNTNKLVDIILMPPTYEIVSLGNLMHMDPSTHDAYKESYIKYEDFK